MDINKGSGDTETRISIKDRFKELVKKVDGLNKNTVISALLVFIIILLLALILTLCSSGRDRTENIAGIYEIETIKGASESGVSDEDLKTMKGMDLTITLELQDNGNGVLNTFGEETEVSYDLDTGRMIIGGQEAIFSHKRNKLTVKQDGTEMTFKK